MERYNNIVCVSKPELTEGVSGAADIKRRQIMSESTYKMYVYRNPHVRVRMGKGKGSPALLSVELLRGDLKAAVVAKYGDPARLAKRGGIMGLYVTDVKAAEYFSRYILPDGKKLKPERAREYTSNASMFNAIATLVGDRALLRRAMGDNIRGLWPGIADEVAELKTTYKHNLPKSHRRLKSKFDAYVAEGYDSLINGGFGNKNRLIVTDAIEKLVLSLYCLPEKPYVTTVVDMYLQFLGGTLDIFSYDTGQGKRTKKTTPT